MALDKVVVGFTALFVAFLLAASVISIYREGAFLVPGLAPNTYIKGANVPLKVNKVTSVRAPIPFRYHDLPVCVPADKDIVYSNENLGEVITGNRIESSVYRLNFLEKKDCIRACDRDLTKEDQERLRQLIEDQYMVHWQVDGLPIATKATSPKTKKIVYEIGFPLGFRNEDEKAPPKAHLNNHVQITIHYSPHVPVAGQKPTSDQPQYNVVMFEVQPFSIDYSSNQWEKVCKSGDAQPLDLIKVTDKRKVTYTYSVDWQLSKTNWANRWHDYVALQADGQVHWFSIINSVLIVLFLSGMVAMIMTRILHRDFRRYSEMDAEEVEETGWKLLSRDVFRPPVNRMFFSVLVGSGAQVLAMTVVTMVFAVLGFLSPANQGTILTAVLVLYVWMGVLAGYSATRIYQYLGGERMTRNTLFTAVFFPGTVFGIAFFLNFFLWYKGSSGAFPFLTMLAIFALWIFISIPLTFVGSRFALRREPIKVPVTVNQIPRQIPEQPWYMNSALSILMGGILPFGAVFIELFFIMSSIWLHRYYYLFGFLFIVFCILIITCAEISIVMVYFQLVAEDWRWWWRSYLTSGASALYMFGYAIFYYVNSLDMDGFVPSLLYFGYCAIICCFFFVLTGALGFYSSHWFVRKIYQAIRQD